jgi:hypothetical protein
MRTFAPISRPDPTAAHVFARRSQEWIPPVRQTTTLSAFLRESLLVACSISSPPLPCAYQRRIEMFWFCSALSAAGVLEPIICSCLVAEFASYWLHRLVHSYKLPLLSRGYLAHHLLRYGPLRAMLGDGHNDARRVRFSPLTASSEPGSPAATPSTRKAWQWHCYVID